MVNDWLMVSWWQMNMIVWGVINSYLWCSALVNSDFVTYIIMKAAIPVLLSLRSRASFTMTKSLQFGYTTTICTGEPIVGSHHWYHHQYRVKPSANHPYHNWLHHSWGLLLCSQQLPTASWSIQRLKASTNGFNAATDVAINKWWLFGITNDGCLV